jgi:CDP-diacylglycerol---glycerol-3-phosphate 3-phosphatidyltransferase
MSVQSVPNLLAVFRIVATVPLIWLIAQRAPGADLGAAVLLLVIAISDILDGPLARRLGAVSPLGIFLDTIADKIFVAGALIPLVERGLLWVWVAVLIIARDYLISALRSYAATRGQVLSARKWGKQKLILTTAALIWFLMQAHVAAGGALAGVPGIAPLAQAAPYVMGLALIWTVGSALDYLAGAWELLRADWAPQRRGEGGVPEQRPQEQLPS